MYLGPILGSAPPSPCAALAAYRRKFQTFVASTSVSHSIGHHHGWMTDIYRGPGPKHLELSERMALMRFFESGQLSSQETQSGSKPLLRALFLDGPRDSENTWVETLGRVGAQALTIERAETIEEAQHRLIRHPYHLFLTQCPKQASGSELEQLRRLRSRSPVPMVLVVSSKEDPAWPLVLLAGLEGVILNPSSNPHIVYRELLRVVTRHQAEARLHDIQRLASVGGLASRIAHEFNNLLAIVKNNAHMLASEVTDRDHLEMASEVMEAAERGASLVRHLSAYSRPGPGGAGMVDLNALLHKLGNATEALSRGRIEVVRALDANLPPVVADAQNVDQALFNLLCNAREAMPNGGRLTLSSETVEGEDIEAPGVEPRRAGFVRLGIEDTGRGIAPEHLPHIFEPFFGTKAPGEGSGLGLTTVRGLMQQCGGFVTVDSVLGSGTKFELLFPLEA